MKEQQVEGSYDIAAEGSMKLAEAEQCPQWYGVAYYEFDTGRRIAAPIPLHWIMRYARVAWYWVRFAGRQGAIDEAYWRGYRDGVRRVA